MSAKIEGQLARQQGKAENDNPYATHSLRHLAWLDGYRWGADN